MIIGLVGSLAAGKGTVTRYLIDTYGAKSVRFSDPLRDIIHRLYHTETREYMSHLATFLRSEFGDDILVRVLLHDVDATPGKLFVLDGLRYKDEYAVLSRRDDFQLWAVDTALETRYQRIIKRGENAAETELTLEQFTAQHKLPTELFTPELMKKADSTIDNNGDLKALYAQVDSLARKLNL